MIQDYNIQCTSCTKGKTMPKYVAKLTHKQRRARRRAIARFSETHTNQETANHFGVTRPTIRHARREAGLPTKADGLLPMSSYGIVAKIIEGRTDMDIARLYVVSKQFVSQVRMRAGKAGVYAAVNKKLKSLRVADADDFK